MWWLGSIDGMEFALSCMEKLSENLDVKGIIMLYSEIAIDMGEVTEL